MAARLAADVGDDDLQLWDWRYYDTQLRKTEYGVDVHAVAAYFPLQQVLDGLLEITGEVFGLEYRRCRRAGLAPRRPQLRHRRPASGARIAVVHMDLHPREGKFSHAAAFDLVPGRRLRRRHRTAPRCRRSSPTSRSRPRSARRCCRTTRS